MLSLRDLKQNSSFSSFSSFLFFIFYFFIFLFFSQAAVSVKISNLFICFCGFYLSCPILEKDNFIENTNIVLSCLIKLLSFLTLFVLIYFRTLAVLLVLGHYVILFELLY